MIVIGLTGGIASGKSHVARLLGERGAVVLDADRHARDALDEPSVRDALVERWGDAVLTEAGKIERSAVASRVFGRDDTARAERRFLEGLVHPLVRQRLGAELEAAKNDGAPAAVLDIPLLIEAGWADRCDVVLYVDTPDELRRQRAADRGWGQDELARREAAQTPLAHKKRRADRLVPGHTERAARAAVEAFWAEEVR